jgi:hypothetical protein
MGTYNSAVITNAGQAMIAQSFAGSDLRFTTVKTSAYVYPAGTNFSELVTINSIKQSKGITGAAVYNSRVIKVSAMVDNAGITSAYDINTIGVYASVGTDAEQLFAVITAIDADTMPAFNNRPYSYIYELNLTVGSTENLTVTVNNAGFVNVNDLNVAVEGKLSTDGNASQVTVDFTSGDLADSDVTKDTGYTPVAKVDSGETATSLLTKISNVIKNVRWIYKLLGTSDISSVGNGTVTNAVATLKSNVGSLNDAITTVQYAYSDGAAFKVHYLKFGKIVFAFSNEPAKINMTAGTEYVVNGSMTYKPYQDFFFDTIVRNGVQAHVLLRPTSTPNFRIVPRQNIAIDSPMAMAFMYITST